MQHVESRHPKGTVIVPAASLARYNEFWLAVESVRVPQGTRLIAARGADIPHQLNEGIRKMEGEWVWILGDDHTFDPDILLALLDRDLDVVLPVVPRRDHPFGPCLLHGPVAKLMTAYEWWELPTKGLWRLPKNDSAGQAGMIVRKPILERIGDPYFEGGKLTPGRLMEDMYFVQRLHDLTVPIFVDCDQVLGHIANIAVVPQRYQGQWFPGYVSGKHGPVLWDNCNPLIRRVA